MAEAGMKAAAGTLMMGVDANGAAQFISALDTAAVATALGTPADEPWNGTDPSATVISLLKAIAANTTPGG